MRPRFLLLILFSAQILSCNNSNEKTVNTRKPGKNELADLNSYLVQKDRDRIQSYIERKNLLMKETPSGLWYLIENEGKGEFFAENDKVVFEYKCSLLDGTICYSSKLKGPREVHLGKSEIETGLIEGIKMLKPGGEAIFILPPFMAYGIVGDGKAIPPRSVIVYEIKAVTAKNK
jgi:FKBP-type peptidyl-prolyl cis-trans isomerase FkpA